MELFRLSAFLMTKEGGNKAGVVLDAETLSENEMQKIAHDVGYSETAFVLPSNQADFKVRFFTPQNEVDLCGHATIATFNLLRDEKRIKPGRYHQETKAGILALDVLEDLVYMEQNPPHFGEILKSNEVEACFEETDFIDKRYPIQVMSTGLREIFVPIKSVDILHKLTSDVNAITALSKQYNTIGMHLFSLDNEVDAYGRNFAPVVGIDEESATGTSNGALACYLYRHVTAQSTFTLRQGFSMNQPSEIYSKLVVQDKSIKQVWVGGPARILE